jgi:hypothetical protein
MGLCAIPCLFHTGSRTPGEGRRGRGNKTKEINIFSILVKCIHVWCVFARGDCLANTPCNYSLLVLVQFSICQDKQWFLNNEGNIFERRNFTFAQLNVCVLCFSISRKREALFCLDYKAVYSGRYSTSFSREILNPPPHKAIVKFPAVCCYALTRPHGVTCRKTYM